MKIPDLSAFCAKAAPAETEKCIRFPGGARLCIPDPHTGSPLQQVRALLKLISAALMPLQPFFNVLNVIKAIKKAIDAVPDLLTDPTKLVQAIVELAKAFGALIALFPQVSVPILVKDILVVVSFALRAIAEELESFVAAEQAIADAATLAQSTGLDALVAEVSCAQDNFEIEMANLNASLGPLAQLLDIINTLLGLAGLEAIALDLTSSASPTEAIAAMLAIADAIDIATSAIPV